MRVQICLDLLFVRGDAAHAARQIDPADEGMPERGAERAADR